MHHLVPFFRGPKTPFPFRRWPERVGQATRRRPRTPGDRLVETKGGAIRDPKEGNSTACTCQVSMDWLKGKIMEQEPPIFNRKLCGFM